jgi:hypothetical protein
VTTIFESEAVKKYALRHAGEIFKFRDGLFDKINGRIVGYYFSTAQLVMETDSEPKQPIDPINGALDSNGVALLKGSFYTFCFLSDLIVEGDDDEDTDKLSVFPHTCNICKSPALVMFRTIECSSTVCKNYLKKR